MAEGGELNSRTTSYAILIGHAATCWEAEQEYARKLDGRESLILSAIAVLLGIGVYQMEWYHEPAESMPAFGARLTFKVLLLLALASFVYAFFGLFGAFLGKLNGVRDRARYRVLQAFVRLNSRRWTRRDLCRKQGQEWTANLYRYCKVAIWRHERRLLKDPSHDQPKRRSAYLLALPPEFFASLPEDIHLSDEIAFLRLYEAYLDLVKQNAAKEKRLDKFQQFFYLGVALTVLTVFLYIIQIGERTIGR